jgi:glutamyl-Q tRNA(Asp) synthetase
MRGRFAPSPTGPLHVGSLFAAVGSYLDARAQGGEWLLRIEDVDRGREVPGAADGILRTLERFGLHWDGPVRRQSERSEAYEAVLLQLAARGLAYPCSCTRAEVAGAAPREDGGKAPELRYDGRCRRGPARPHGPLALRFRTEGAPTVTVHDRLQPPLTQAVDVAVGDFPLKRRDGFYAYQLAVVVDDADQGVTDVVRGLDLYDNTPRQVLLQRSLALPVPRYLHLPLVVDASGTKLSKSRRALPADAGALPAALTYILSALRHPPPGVLRRAPPATLLEWAVQHWNPSKLQGVTTISSDF